ncbi:hypothetical protein OHV05_15225 [Kitasatospora sp. NBC_00070]|uniref:hypothetical protein n=1 Tax=Kitasatospora sp. NBC_00070 TaxID=2975962 RepID=UPI003245D2B8
METTPRVALQLNIHLTFAEILGLLLLSPDGCLSWEHVENPVESEITDCMWFAVADTSMNMVGEYATMAMDIYTGRRASNLHSFALRLGTVITHIFGVTSPEQPSATVPAQREWRAVPAGYVHPDGMLA